MQSLGYKVTFLPQNLAHFGSYTEEMERSGVEVITAPFFLSVPEFPGAARSRVRRRLHHPLSGRDRDDPLHPAACASGADPAQQRRPALLAGIARSTQRR